MKLEGWGKPGGELAGWVALMVAPHSNSPQIHDFLKTFIHLPFKGKPSGFLQELIQGPFNDFKISPFISYTKDCVSISILVFLNLKWGQAQSTRYPAEDACAPGRSPDQRGGGGSSCTGTTSQGHSSAPRKPPSFSSMPQFAG